MRALKWTLVTVEGGHSTHSGLLHPFFSTRALKDSRTADDGSEAMQVRYQNGSLFPTQFKSPQQMLHFPMASRSMEKDQAGFTQPVSGPNASRQRH